MENDRMKRPASGLRPQTKTLKYIFRFVKKVSSASVTVTMNVIVNILVLI